jgi:hypothetical protein
MDFAQPFTCNSVAIYRQSYKNTRCRMMHGDRGLLLMIAWRIDIE